jgi:hypothetical protein
MPTPIWSCGIRDGQLFLDRREEFDAWIKARRNGRYDLVVKEHRDKRTTPQNRYYRGVVLPIFAECAGWDTEDLHYELRKHFLPGADHTRPPRHTADLDTAEMTRFIDDVRRLAASYGYYIPDPNEAEA